LTKLRQLLAVIEARDRTGIAMLLHAWERHAVEKWASKTCGSRRRFPWEPADRCVTPDRSGAAGGRRR
jgi:hypothetical protein